MNNYQLFRRTQGGFSIVELMVASVISLVLLAGIMQIFAGSKATYRMSEGLSRLQESGRFALHLINQSVRIAGYSGCVAGVPMTSYLTVSSNLDFNFGQAVYGFEADGSTPGETLELTTDSFVASSTAADWNPDLDADVLGQALPGTDVFVVRGVEPGAVILVPPYQDSAGLFINQGSGFGDGDILMVTDCTKASIFQATNYQDVGGGDARVVHSNAAMTPGNTVSNWPGADTYGAGAELMRMSNTVYFVGLGGTAPNQYPALFRRRLGTGGNPSLVSEELLPGVENMQVLYGVDTTAVADSSVDAYLSAQQVEAANQWDRVISIRVGLLVRSEDQSDTVTDTGTYDVLGTTVDPLDDRRLRRVFTTATTIRNRAP